ncbi:MAG: cytochrome c family protein [Gallionellaceae bacterium]|nr:cytochrome c family protein [Gallionellaceae bacterium]
MTKRIWRVTQVVMASLALAMAGHAWPEEPAFVGNKACTGCHKAEALDWQRSAHAKAFDLLAAGRKPAEKLKGKLEPEKNYQKDEKCFKCHTTGYKKPGGFQDVETTPDLVGIGCEMCHGPGKEYREIHKRMVLEFKRSEVQAAGQTYATLGDKVCQNCHDHKDSPLKKELDPKYGFDLEDKMRKARTAFHRITPSIGRHQ